MRRARSGCSLTSFATACKDPVIMTIFSKPIASVTILKTPNSAASPNTMGSPS